MRKRRSCFRTIFAITTLSAILALSFRAWGTEKVLHTFAGQDGAAPYGGLVSDAAGNLYGTTFSGGKFDAGTVFKLDASKKYTETVLHDFTGGGDGGFPAAALVLDSSGNLYGTATCGGSSTCNGGAGGNGVVFALTPSAGGYDFEVLYIFQGNSDGSRPFAPLIDVSGVLYGTTENGGTGNCSGGNGSGCGVVFQLTASGKETILYSFTGNLDGGLPLAPLLYVQGALYGTTFSGGQDGAGTVFELDASSNESVLHSFTGGKDGGFPTAGLTIDSGGNLYGTASCGGGKVKCSGGVGGDGVVFVQPIAGKYAVLHRFKGGDGANPSAGLVFNEAGNLYGTTFAGGLNGCDNNGFSGCGVVFKLEPSSKAYKRLYAFKGGTDSGNPYAGLILGGPAAPLGPPGKGGCTAACVLGTTTGADAPGGAGTVFGVQPQ
jgi:uncharacterized repeat protein (TIGR03803 family)